MGLHVGLTGGIGSGKSTVARIFQVLGVPVYYADQAARRLMEENDVLKERIRGIFGEEAYRDGRLNSRYISSIVFRNPGKLEQLNALVHPETLKDAAEWMGVQQSPYSIKEAALLFESGAQQDLDYVIGVSAPENLRIERTMQRDRLPREEVIERMNSQIPESTKMRLCNFVVYNDEQQSVVQQVLALHEKLTALSKQSR